jgi:hypothetical protein
VSFVCINDREHRHECMQPMHRSHRRCMCVAPASELSDSWLTAKKHRQAEKAAGSTGPDLKERHSTHIARQSLRSWAPGG